MGWHAGLAFSLLWLFDWLILIVWLDTRAMRTWPSPVRRKCARSANRSSRRWRPSTRASRTDASSTASTARPCASTWSISSTNSSISPRNTWWIASSRTSPYSKYVYYIQITSINTKTSKINTSSTLIISLFNIITQQFMIIIQFINQNMKIRYQYYTPIFIWSAKQSQLST